MICLKKLTFSSHPRAIVKPQEPPSPAELTFETQLFFFQKQQTNTPAITGPGSVVGGKRQETGKTK